MTFSDYKQQVFSSIKDLEQLRDYCNRLSLAKSADQINDVVRRVNENSFIVAIFGEFKKGKSTTLNALLGKNILPTARIPATATLNYVTYGLNPSAVIEFKDRPQETLDDLSQLASYVTKLTEESEQTAKEIEQATIYYPSPLLQNGVELIDTPGLNDDARMQEIALSVLTKVDAAIMVLRADSPLSSSEQDFLENRLLSADLGRIIFVINVPDGFTDDETAQIVDFIHKRIKDFILQRAEQRYSQNSNEYNEFVGKIGDPKIFPFNAKQALAAKENNNSELLRQSRFADFEQFLQKFLTEGRGLILLQVANNRIIASANQILEALDLRESAWQMKKEEFQVAYEKLLQEIAALRQKKLEEMQKVGQAADNVKRGVAPMLAELESMLKNAAEEAIKSADIEPHELRNQDKLLSGLNNRVSSAVNSAAQRLAEKVQAQIERNFVVEMTRLGKVMTEFDQKITDLKVEIFGIIPENPRDHNVLGEVAAAAIGIIGGYGGMWSGYRVAGFKGFLAGWFASAVTTVGVALAAGALFPPGVILTTPMIVGAYAGMALLNFFTGGWFTEKLFGTQQVDQFKSQYREQVLQRLDEQLCSQNLRQEVNQYISKTFEFLKNTMDREVELLLDGYTSNLSDLRDQRQREEVMSEGERTDLEQLRSETTRILRKAKAFLEIQQPTFPDFLETEPFA